jgi:hypothetical protein
MDEQLRRAERAAATGNPEDVAHWRRLCGRRGLFFKDYAPDEVLSEWEEAQQDYDDSWWHANTPRKCGLWNRGDLGHYDFDFKTAVFKAHHRWGHYYVSGNSKRQTIRTHRDGSRRNYRLRN